MDLLFLSRSLDLTSFLFYSLARYASSLWASTAPAALVWFSHAPLFGFNNCFLYFSVLCILRGVFLRRRIKTVFLHLISLRDLYRHRGFSKITPLNSIFVIHIIFMEIKWPWVDFLLPVQLSILSALWNLIFGIKRPFYYVKWYHLYSWSSELACGELYCKDCILHLRSVAKIYL